LITGRLDDWNDFIAKFKDTTHPEIITSLSFKISYGDPATEKIYSVAGDDLREITSYLDLVGRFSQDNVNTTYTDPTITFATVDIGPQQGVLTYLQNVAAGVPEGAKLLSGVQPDWNEFKAGLGETTTFSFKINDSEGVKIFEYTDVNVTDIASWVNFVTTLNAFPDAMVKVYYTETNKLLFVTTARGVTATMGNASSETTIHDDTNLAKYLKITTDSGASLIQGADVHSTVDAATALKGTQNSPEVQNIKGSGDIHNDQILMKKFFDLISKNGVLPTAVCLSRYLNLNADNNTDVDTTITLINGFNTHFAYTGQQTTSVLCIASNIYEADDDGVKVNPYQNVINQPNSRNLILHYQKNLGEYPEGAIATFIAGIPWESEDAARNFKGLDLPAVTVDKEIDSALEARLTGFNFNMYALMSNGTNMFREGITCSNGDVRYIDTAVGINALITDLKDKLSRILKAGKVRFNAEGVSLIYSALQNVCQKYVTNGFLSDMLYTQPVEGEEKNIVIQPYTINMSRNYTYDDITRRSFPATEILICSSRFANSFTINLADAFMEIAA
jgi:hypothetical protein